MIQKNLYWENFLKMFQNGPIRKVITKKVIFEDFLIFSPAVGHPGSTLRKILEDFFKKSQVRNSHYLFSGDVTHTALQKQGDAHCGKTRTGCRTHHFS